MSWRRSTMRTKASKFCVNYLCPFIFSTQFILIDISSIKIIKDHCMQFIIKEENFTDVVMSSEFSDLDKPLLVEIIRKRLHSFKMVMDTSFESNIGENVFHHYSHIHVY